MRDVSPSTAGGPPMVDVTMRVRRGDDAYRLRRHYIVATGATRMERVRG